jgi:hypothetical protein
MKTATNKHLSANTAACHPEEQLHRDEGSSEGAASHSALSSASLLALNFPLDNDDLLFDHIDDLVNLFAASDHADDADLTFIVAFTELAAERSHPTLLSLTKAEVVPLTIDLLRDCDGDEEELVESLAAMWTWLGGEGAGNAPEVIEALLDLDPSALPRVHAFRKKKSASE